ELSPDVKQCTENSVDVCALDECLGPSPHRSNRGLGLRVEQDGRNGRRSSGPASKGRREAHEGKGILPSQRSFDLDGRYLTSTVAPTSSSWLLMESASSWA